MAAVAWTGGVLFVLSLAYFVFSYAVTFATPAPAGPVAGPTLWNTILFTMFALHHSVFAREGVRVVITRTFRREMERSVYVWVASVLFLAVCALWQPVPGVAWRAGEPWLWVLRVIQLAGVVVTLRGASILDFRELAGIRPPSTPSEFKLSGPYGWVRHPIYTGWFLMVWAASPMTMTRFVFAAVSSAYLLLAIPLEERSLRRASAGAYDRYTSQVRWKLVPWLY